MAKIYGSRWQITSSVANGGQAEVFKVRDLAGEYTEELALKRIRNPKRHDRFRAEVEAIKRLAHPNVIRLIDHSALADGGEVPDRQFIVMPFAGYGDLTKRVALYANNPDSVVQVAKSLALALRAAHGAGIVHRDVKPQNVLFPTDAHDIWLADFGICLIRDLARGTPADEVVGPVQFMAPELESGGQLDVSPSADIYSLGKLIYYMLSGGVVLPRERLQEPEFARIFAHGERQRLIQMLLSRMVCNASIRLTSMDDVISELDRVENWGRDARLLPIGSKTMSAIDEMKRRALLVHRQVEANADIRSRRQAATAATLKGTIGWLCAELEKTAALIADGIAINAAVREVDQNDNDVPLLSGFRSGPAVELWVKNKYEGFSREHILRFSIYLKSGFQVKSRIVVGPEPAMQLPPSEQEHLELMVVPVYGQKVGGNLTWNLVTANGRLHRVENSQSRFHRQPTLHGNATSSISLCAVSFSTENWPSAADEFPPFFQASVDTFVSALSISGGPLGS